MLSYNISANNMKKYLRIAHLVLACDNKLYSTAALNNIYNCIPNIIYTGKYLMMVSHEGLLIAIRPSVPPRY